MKTAIVVGSGAGGSTVARELQGDFQVTVLEAGGPFKPFAGNLRMLEQARHRLSGLFFSERQIEWLVPHMKVARTADGMVLVNGMGQGGSTTLSTGSAVRHDHDLKALGIELDDEFESLARELPISTGHQSRWHAPTREAYRVCRDLGLEPQPTPKMIRLERCISCGRCVLGCARGAKWDSREQLQQAVDNGAQLLPGCSVREVVIEGGRATGVVTANAGRGRLHRADLIVLAAGGFGTPALLQRSGLECTGGLFVDPVLCVAARWKGAAQHREIPMPFIVQAEHYAISPYFDYLSYFFDRNWRHPAGDIFSLMIKLADTSAGTVTHKGVRKHLQQSDQTHLRDGVDRCKAILHGMGARDADIFLGTLNAGHPGGMLPLTERESRTLHHEHLPANLYVADATLLPRSMGNPPILTIMALARRIARLCKDGTT
jgi:choline dehydrogenase-like flavoprotein